MKSPDEKNVHIIVEGTAQIFHLHPDGKECVIGLMMPGDCIGLLDILIIGAKDGPIIKKSDGKNKEKRMVNIQPADIVSSM